MKKLNIYLWCLLGSLIIFSCEDPDPLADISADLNSNAGNPYVVADASSATLDSTASQTVTIELPTSIAGNVSVNFSIAGTAVAGTDYTLTAPAGVTVSGNSGSGDIVFDITAGGSDGFDLTVATEGDPSSIGKTIEIALTGATAADGRAIDLGILNRGSAVTMTIANAE